MSNYQILNESTALSYLSAPDTVASMVVLLADMLLEELPKAQEAVLSHDLSTFKTLLHGWNGSLGYFVDVHFAKELQSLEQLADSADAQAACVYFWQSMLPGLQMLVQEAKDYARQQ